MSLAWFHVAKIPEVGDRVRLDAEEARHARGSRRLREGDRLVVFDGAGSLAEARVVARDKREVAVEVAARQRQAEPTPSLHLLSALPKGDRVATLIGMATQLGMQSFTPLSCERSVVQPSDALHARWSRIVREACKQSRRAHLPFLHAPQTPQAAATRLEGTRLVVLDPRGRAAADWLAEQAAAPATPVALFVGPEGGFSDAEVSDLRDAGAQPLCATDGILRIETAALAALAITGLLRAPAPD